MSAHHGARTLTIHVLRLARLPLIKILAKQTSLRNFNETWYEFCLDPLESRSSVTILEQAKG